jgi:hypothetical protein
VFFDVAIVELPHSLAKEYFEYGLAGYYEALAS